MANETSVLARAQLRPGVPDTGDYQAFSEVLAASERGRAFLAEHARRSRGTYIELLLAALTRLEALMRAKTASAADPLRAELAALLAAIRSARPELEASALPARAVRLAALLDLLEQRIAAMAAPAPLPAAAVTAEAGRARLSVVPPPEEPELPIPSPAPAPSPPVALTPTAQAPAAKTTASIPEVVWYDGGLPDTGGFADDVVWERAMATTVAAQIAALREPQAKPPAQAAAVDEGKLWELSDAKPAPPPDPLAAFMRLSEEERIALFT